MNILWGCSYSGDELKHWPPLSSPRSIWSHHHLPALVGLCVVHQQLQRFAFAGFDQGEEILRLQEIERGVKDILFYFHDITLQKGRKRVAYILQHLVSSNNEVSVCSETRESSRRAGLNILGKKMFILRDWIDENFTWFKLKRQNHAGYCLKYAIQSRRMTLHSCYISLTKTCQTFSLAPSKLQKRTLAPSRPWPPHMLLGVTSSSLTRCVFELYTSSLTAFSMLALRRSLSRSLSLF